MNRGRRTPMRSSPGGRLLTWLPVTVALVFVVHRAAGRAERQGMPNTTHPTPGIYVARGDAPGARGGTLVVDRAGGWTLHASAGQANERISGRWQGGADRRLRLEEDLGMASVATWRPSAIRIVWSELLLPDDERALRFEDTERITPAEGALVRWTGPKETYLWKATLESEAALRMRAPRALGGIRP